MQTFGESSRLTRMRRNLNIDTAVEAMKRNVG